MDQPLHHFCLLALSVLFICWMPEIAQTEVDQKEVPAWDPSLVTLQQGQVRGIKETAANGNEFYSFRGLPFAKPPVGELRFKRPDPAEAWEGIRDAEQPSLICAQPDAMSLTSGLPLKPDGAEDCLYLNVFSPRPQLSRDEPLLPVMVFIHGGGYMFGGADVYPPHTLLSENIVLVVIQYRLGTLGFLSTEDDVAPGNMGIHDQTMAFKWTHDNIAAFGGDPERVTIFGESAGGASSHLHILTHSSEGYFQRAILQSGTALSTWAISSKHKEAAYAVGRAAGCEVFADTENTECTQDEAKPGAYEACLVDSLSSEALLHCLRQAPADLLGVSCGSFCRFSIFPMTMAPRVEKNLLMQEPAQLLKEANHKKIDIMLGVTKHEGAMTTLPLYASEHLRSMFKTNFEETAQIALDFSEGDIDPLQQTMKIFDYYVGSTEVNKDTADNLTEMFGDMHFWYSVDTTARLHSENVSPGKKTFLYEFAHRGDPTFADIYGADIENNWVTHASELMYLFSGGPLLGTLQNEEDKRVSQTMVKLWANFAATGNPSPEGSPVEWRPFSVASPELLIIDAHPRMDSSDRKSKIRDFWRSLPLKTSLILFPNEVTAAESAAEAFPTTEEELNKDEL